MKQQHAAHAVINGSKENKETTVEEEKEPKEFQLSDNQKVMLAATFSSCLLHIKKTTQEGTETKPPTPQESLEAYQTDPLINRYANGCVVGVLEILKLKEV